MLRFITCDDNLDALNKTIISINKTMMPYNYDYKIDKFIRYNDDLKNIIYSKGDEKIYLLDIELPETSGIEIASEIRESGDWESMIIFVSIHPEFKDNIFYKRIMAIDFVSKFYNYSNRLDETLDMVLKIYNKNNILLFHTENNSYRIPINKIMYIEKINNNKKCVIFLEDGLKYEVGATLKSIGDKLPPYFYQTHKSCIINTSKIEEIDYIEPLIIFNNNMNTSLLSNRNKKGLRDYVEYH